MSTDERTIERARKYIGAAVHGTIEEAARAGNRNDGLNRAAFTLGRMVVAGWCDEDWAISRLEQVAEANGLVEEDGMRSVWGTIRSGLQAGMHKANPAELPRDLDVDLAALGLTGLTPEELERARAMVAARREEARRKRMEAARLVTEAGYLREAARRLDEDALALEALHARGIHDRAAHDLGFGSARWPRDGAPDDWGPANRVPSILLPWRDLDGNLEALQYRHLTENVTAKVRWDHACRPGSLFNAQAVSEPHDDRLMVVEGALNAATLYAAGMTSVVGLSQLRGWKPRLVEQVESAGFAEVVFIPDGNGEAAAIWAGYARTVEGGRIAPLGLDPDDFLAALGGNVDRFWRALRYASVAP